MRLDARQVDKITDDVCNHFMHAELHGCTMGEIVAYTLATAYWHLVKELGKHGSTNGEQDHATG